MSNQISRLQHWEEQQQAKALKVTQAAEAMTEARRVYNSAVREDKGRAFDALTAAAQQYQRALAIPIAY